MKKKALQSIANWILSRMEKTNNVDVAWFYYDMGMLLDDLCIHSFGLYLD